MKEIEQILKTEVEKYINKNPYKNDKTIKGLSNRLKYMSDNAQTAIGNISNGMLTQNNTTHIKQQQSRLQQLVPTIGSFHTPLPLREAFEIYNEKHRLVRCE